jgi:hypothetical protein
MDILFHVRPFLTKIDQSHLTSTSRIYQLGPEYGPLWFSRPWSPNRQRRWGFGSLHPA